MNVNKQYYVVQKANRQRHEIENLIWTGRDGGVSNQFGATRSFNLKLRLHRGHGHVRTSSAQNINYNNSFHFLRTKSNGNQHLPAQKNHTNNKYLVFLKQGSFSQKHKYKVINPCNVTNLKNCQLLSSKFSATEMDKQVGYGFSWTF